MRAYRRTAVLIPLLSLAACTADPAGPDIPLTEASAALGRAAFVRSCAGCHASGDGYDIALFGFTDTTIIRRATAHVDLATAKNIVAHIRSLAIQPVPETLRIFQPGEGTVPSDVDFAQKLFGQDQWPQSLTTAQLRAIDPRNVQLAVGMPVWSDEAQNIDWMPDDSLPPAILDHAGSAARAAIAGYRAAPTLENLSRAVLALRRADRDSLNAGAPCLLEDAQRADFETCFQVRRWTATLVAQHMLRNGITGRLDAALHDAWWDVGNAARKSRNAGQPIANAVSNWASWMLLGWSFEPGAHASVYTGGSVFTMGLSRHATFIALRSQVERKRNDAAVYADARQAVRFAPDAWAYNVATFGFRHLLERQASGEQPRPADMAAAADNVRTALAAAKRKVSAAQFGMLEKQASQLLASLATMSAAR